MNKHETAQITTESTIQAQEASFAVQDARSEEIEVVEFDAAPLTDINFGF